MNKLGRHSFNPITNQDNTLNNTKNQSYILYLSSYPPRKCGIAAFTKDLSTAIDKISNPKLKSKIAALNDNGNSYDYSDDVLFQIDDADEGDYIKVAQAINEDNKIKLVNVQHEFKIFGSDYGENLLVFLKALKKPVITTLHSVLPSPSEKRKEIIRSIADKSACLVVMNKLALDILRKDYELNDSKIVVIPHGIHKVAYVQTEHLKEKLGYKGKILLTSFGFLRPGRGARSSGRGYEYVLDALPAIIKKFPNVLHLIIGMTHPQTIKKEGEEYREFLKTKVKELNIENNVKFINRYVSLGELFQYLQASDIYICSSLNKNQIVSGTLAYAMGCGCAVVSTPSLHAKQIIMSERGILLDEFRNPELISKAIIRLLSNPSLKDELKKNAYSFTRSMLWDNVAGAYKEIFEKYADLSKEY